MQLPTNLASRRAFRLTTLVVVTAVAVGTGGLASAAAPRITSTALSLSASATTILPGGSVDLQGRLTDNPPKNDHGVGGKQVQFCTTPSGGATTCSNVGTSDPWLGSGGSYKVQGLTPVVTTTYQAHYAGDSTYAQADSPAVTVVVNANTTTTLTSSKTTIFPGSSVDLTGMLKNGLGDGVASRTVTLTGGGLAPEVQTTGPGGIFKTPAGQTSFKRTPASTATYTLSYAGVAGGYAPSSSDVTVTVNRATALTGSVSANVVWPGDKVTIKGTLKNADNSSVPGVPVQVCRTPASATEDCFATKNTGTGLTDKGDVEFTDNPAVATSYQLKFAGNAAYEASNSAVWNVAMGNQTTISMAASQTDVVAGTEITLSGTLKDTQDNLLASKTVNLCSWPTGDQTEQTCRQTTTGWVPLVDKGDWSLKDKPMVPTTYQVFFPGEGGYAESSSAPVDVQVTNVPTALSIETSSKSILPGTKIEIKGRLTDGRGDGVPNVPVQICRTPANGAEDCYATVNTTTSSLIQYPGWAAFTDTPTVTTVYQLKFAAYDKYAASTSPQAQVDVNGTTALSLSASASSILPGGSVKLTGKLTDANGDGMGKRIVALCATPAGGTQSCSQTATTESWDVLHPVDVTGRVTFTLTPPTTTSYELAYTGTGGYLDSDSNDVTVTVNRATTLSGQADPEVVLSGDKVEISGTLKDAKGNGLGEQTVALCKTPSATGVEDCSRTAETSNGVLWWGKGAIDFTDHPAGGLTDSVTYQLKYVGNGAYDPSNSPTDIVTFGNATTLTANADKTDSEAGSRVYLSGDLKDTLNPPGPLASKKITLCSWPTLDTGAVPPEQAKTCQDTTTGWVPFITKGHWSLSDKPLVDTSYQASYAGDGTYAASASSVVNIAVHKVNTHFGTLTATATKSSVSSPVTLNARLWDQHNYPVVGESVQVCATTAGQTTCESHKTTGILDLLFHPLGTVEVKVVPTKGVTTYQFKYAGASIYNPSVTRSVTVTPVVTPTLLITKFDRTPINEWLASALSFGPTSTTIPLGDPNGTNLVGMLASLPKIAGVDGQPIRFCSRQNATTGPWNCSVMTSGQSFLGLPTAGLVFKNLKPTVSTDYTLQFLGNAAGLPSNVMRMTVYVSQSLSVTTGNGTLTAKLGKGNDWLYLIRWVGVGRGVNHMGWEFVPVNGRNAVMTKNGSYTWTNLNLDNRFPDSYQVVVLHNSKTGMAAAFSGVYAL